MKNLKELKKFINTAIDCFDVGIWEKEINFTKRPGNADMEVNHRYKTFTMNIHQNFFDQDKTYQANTIIHEFCHLFNLPVANLVGDCKNGNLITSQHLDDVLENANVHAEKVVVNLLFDDTLAKAYKEYVRPKQTKNRLRSVKSSPKLTKKQPKKKTGTR
jgi:hypothetical protein